MSFIDVLRELFYKSQVNSIGCEGKISYASSSISDRENAHSMWLGQIIASPISKVGSVQALMITVPFVGNILSNKMEVLLGRCYIYRSIHTK